MFLLHGTHKLLQRLPPASRGQLDRSTTALGDWYATLLFWKPHVALLVNEATLLPVLMPFAPGATLPARFPEALAGVLAAHGASRGFIDTEAAEMRVCQLAKTANRSVVGVMNEFAYLAGRHRQARGTDQLSLSLRLARTPCGPLYSRHLSPDRELAVFLSKQQHR